MDSTRDDILSYIAVGMIARDAAHPDLARDQAERMLSRHEKAVRGALKAPANGLCRTCGSPDPHAQ